MPSQDLSRRAVVTGLGAVTPIGNDHPTFWRNLVAGVSGGGPITPFDPTGYDVRIAAEVKDFDPTVAMDRKMARRMSRFIHLAMAAGKEAVEDSGLDFSDWSPERRDRVAVCVNTGGGGLEQVIDGAEVVRVKGPNFVSPFAIPALSGSMAACQLSMEYGLTGPVITQVAACASSVIAFLDGLRMIQRGEVDVVLAGGSEAPLLAMAFAALGNMGALSKRNDDPTHASRPFDRDRDGFLFGEGAGVVVVESAEHALARGARIQAEVVGAALTADAFHISAPEPTGRGATMAMTKAMADAGLAPDEIDYIVAHGTSTPLNDVTETRAIKAAFGAHAHKVPISSPKSMVGHLLGAAGVASRADRPRRHPRGRHPADRQPRAPRPARVRPRLRAAGGAQGEGRHGDVQRLRLRRPERGRRLPALRGVARSRAGTAPEGGMRRTNLSLYYLAGYLIPAGLLLLFVPQTALDLLFSNGTYDVAPFRLVGILLIVLGVIIVQIIRFKIDELYTTTIAVRIFISTGLMALFLTTGDPFFLVIFFVVAFGLVLTSVSYMLDRRDRAA